ncbi:endopeptidase La [Mycoplasma iguanae]|uniref:Lon protease n=1 Tax=Mycoplasma iguanae TaxID=292461 RepID=A0ABY5RA33_9MOLU|nr:endopeptidase La [Mycoplasma iguanae]
MLIPFVKLHREIYFPGTRVTLTSTNEQEKLAMEIAWNSDKKFIALFPSKKEKKNAKINDVAELYHFGVIGQMVSIDSRPKKTKVELNILGRLVVSKIYPSDVDMTWNVMAEVKEYVITHADNEEMLKNRLDIISAIFGDILDNIKHIPSHDKYNLEFLYNAKPDQAVRVVDILCSFLNKTFEQKYDIFSTQSLIEQLDILIDDLQFEEMSREIDNEVDSEIRQNLDAQQREFILREKVKVIRKKLGDDNADDEDEFIKYTSSGEGKLIYPEYIKKIIIAEKRRLKGMMSTSPEANISRTYLDWLQKLPWRIVKPDFLELKKAKKILDENHFGLKEVKERILEFIAILTKQKATGLDENFKPIRKKLLVDESLFVENKKQKNSPKQKFNVPIITLVGPPGTGKTSLAKSIADAMGRKFVKISLGGVHDESEIRGHRRTYVGAMPGKVIQAIKKAGVSNPLILLDEIDKLSSNYKGDPASAMLEVLDPEQNAHFQDHYLEAEYDLSKVLFIATANYYEGIPEPLMDRVEIIEVSSYTLLEKIQICRDYLIAKTLEQNFLEPEYFDISDEVIEFIIQKYTREAGVRELKRILDKLARKIVVKQINKEIKENKFTITKEITTKFLGVEKFSDEENDGKEQIGAVNGLAYTQYGGSTLSIEVSTSAGKGELKLTGQLKDVMQESAQIALSYVRSNAEQFRIKDFDWDSNNIHIHVPEGAVPKDGPSAGVTFTTAIISALAKKSISHQIGMTGEITLRGKVLAIGGLKEKSLAALKFGIKTVFIPKDNEKNLEELSDQVKKNITFIPVSHYDEIAKYLFK